MHGGAGASRGGGAVDIHRSVAAAGAIGNVDFESIAAAAPTAEQVIVGREAAIECQAAKVLAYIVEVILWNIGQDIFTAGLGVDEYAHLVEVVFDVAGHHDIEATAFDHRITGIQLAAAGDAAGRIAELSLHRLHGQRCAIGDIPRPINGGRGNGRYRRRTQSGLKKEVRTHAGQSKWHFSPVVRAHSPRRMLSRFCETSKKQQIADGSKVIASATTIPVITCPPSALAEF